MHQPRSASLRALGAEALAIPIKALTRIWSEQAAVAGGTDAGKNRDHTRLASHTWRGDFPLTNQREETRSACISMVALVGPYCSPSRRSQDSVDGAVVITGASEPAL